MKEKPYASLSLDLDNQWSYMKTHGDAGWESFPSYLDTVAPRFLNMVEDLGVKMTVFVVGQDAAIPSNHSALRNIAEAGHEIGNHSFHHEPWLHLYSREEVETEVRSAEEAIYEATGQRPTGWRGPGFSYAPAVLETLGQRGYAYDASIFPTYLGPLARAYYFMKSGLKREEKANRKQLFGHWREGLRPLKPFHWNLPGGRTLLEIPVTTLPVIKAPFHLSYLLYLATFSEGLAVTYFRLGLWWCRVWGVAPSFLLHPLDFLGGDDVPELSFFPAMNRTGEWKLKMSRRFLEMLCGSFEVISMKEHVRRTESADIPLRDELLAEA